MFTEQEQQVIDALRMPILKVYEENKNQIAIRLPKENHSMDMACLILNCITWFVSDNLNHVQKNKTEYMDGATITVRIDNMGNGYTCDTRWFVKPLIEYWLKLVLKRELTNVIIDKDPPNNWETVEFTIDNINFLLLIKMDMSQSELDKVSQYIHGRNEFRVIQSDSEIPV